MGAAVFALAIAASAFAQAPPALPHQFYGVGGSAMLDGAARGRRRRRHRHQPGRRGRRLDHHLAADGWFINVASGDASSVTFSIDGSDPSDAYDVTAGRGKTRSAST